MLGLVARTAGPGRAQRRRLGDDPTWPRSNWRQRVGERELEALIHADRTAEDDALLAVGDRSPERGATEAERLDGDEHALGIEAVEDA